MTETTLLQEIDSIIAQINEIPASRNYWFIRTQSGEFYDRFRHTSLLLLNTTNINL